MVAAIHRTDSAGRDWSATHGQENWEARVRQLELRAEALETTLEHRLARLKAEIWGEIWEERLKGLFVISVGIAVVMWVRLIVG